MLEALILNMEFRETFHNFRLLSSRQRSQRVILMLDTTLRYIWAMGTLILNTDYRQILHHFKPLTSRRRSKRVLLLLDTQLRHLWAPGIQPRRPCLRSFPLGRQTLASSRHTMTISSKEKPHSLNLMACFTTMHSTCLTCKRINMVDPTLTLPTKTQIILDSPRNSITTTLRSTNNNTNISNNKNKTQQDPEQSQKITMTSR